MEIPPTPLEKATVYTDLDIDCERLLDPPKSPLKRGTLIPVPPFLRGVRGDQSLEELVSKTCLYTVALQNGKTDASPSLQGGIKRGKVRIVNSGAVAQLDRATAS